MSVIVCRPEKVTRPYYVEDLGVNIYSSQEFCYAIYHHPMLFMDRFSDQNIIDFIRDQLGMGFVAARMEQRVKAGEKPEEVMFLFMQECDYYSAGEMNRFRQMVTSLKKLPPLEYAKRKADYLVEFKQYGRAIAEYQAILEAAKDKKDDSLAAKVWNNLGACYARVFQFQKAMDAYSRTYEKKKDVAVLERMYHLTLLDPGLEIKERYQSMMSGQLKEKWDKDFAQAREKAEESGQVIRLQKLFEKDSLKRTEGAAKLVEEWKQEYRSMA